MKRLLVVYPEGDSPHAIRIVRPLARYLPKRGWRLTLMTAPGQGRDFPAERVEVSARGFNLTHSTPEANEQGAASRGRAAGVRSLVGRHLAVPDRYNLWAVQARRAAHRLPPHDAVLTSGPPHSAHFVGSAYHRRFSVPWVADMRDPWSTNHYTVYSRLTRLLDSALERRCLSSATAIVTVSDQLASVVSALHSRPVETISNSFDPVEFDQFLPPQVDPLIICYAGSLIGGRRRPEVLFRAVARLRTRRPDVDMRLLFLTDQPQLVQEAALEEQVLDLLDNESWAPREAVLAAWQRASVLVLLRWEDPRDEGVPTGKLFEYLGAGRPILSLGGTAGVVGDILAETGVGEHCTSAAQAARYLEKIADHGTPSDVDLSAYSAERMADRFADLLERG